MAQKLVTVVSHPRSGSTFLLSEAGKLDKLYAKMELFHPDEVIIDQHLGALSGKVKERLGWPEKGFRESLLCDPVRYLSAVQEEASAEVLAFKVFPSHLPEEKLVEILLNSDLTIFLLRNVLHSYISSEIAKEVGRYAGVDTSDIKIKFSQSAFLWWIKFITAHFELAFSTVYAQKRPLMMINYEDFQGSPNRREWLGHALLQKLGTQLGIVESRTVIKRQDGRNSALEKVSNPEEMLSVLSEEGLDYLIDGNVATRYSDLRRLAPSVCRNYRKKSQLSQLIDKFRLSAKRAFRTS